MVPAIFASQFPFRNIYLGIHLKEYSWWIFKVCLETTIISSSLPSSSTGPAHGPATSFLFHSAPLLHIKLSHPTLLLSSHGSIMKCRVILGKETPTLHSLGNDHRWLTLRICLINGSYIPHIVAVDFNHMPAEGSPFGSSGVKVKSFNYWIIGL